MERWLKASAAVEAAPVDEKKTDRATAVKAEMAKVWAETPDRDDMLKHAEEWLAFRAPVEVRGCVLREELTPLMLEVYAEKHPEDFAKPVGEVGLGLGLGLGEVVKEPK